MTSPVALFGKFHGSFVVVCLAHLILNFVTKIMPFRLEKAKKGQFHISIHFVASICSPMDIEVFVILVQMLTFNYFDSRSRIHLVVISWFDCGVRAK